VAEVGESTVRRIERGTIRPRPGTARRLAAALGTSPDRIAELAEAVPRLGAERADPPPRDDRLGGCVKEQEFPTVAVEQERADVRLEAGVVGGDAVESTEGAEPPRVAVHDAERGHAA